MNSKPTRLEWKLKNFTRQAFNQYTEKKEYYKNFSITDNHREIQWKLRLNVDSSGAGIHLIHLNQNFCGQPRIKMEASMKSRRGVEELDTFESTCKPGARLGCERFFTVDEVFLRSEKYLKNDTLVLGFSVEILCDNPINNGYHSFEDSGSSQGYPLDDRKVLFETKIYSDFTFICSDDVEVPAHRFILHFASPVFRAMLESQMTESFSKTVFLEDIDSRTINEVLRYIYTKEFFHDSDLAHKVYYAAEKYELTNLKNECECMMVANINIENAVEYLNLAFQTDSKFVLETALPFVQFNYDDLPKEEISKLDPRCLVKLMDYCRNEGKVEYYFETVL